MTLATYIIIVLAVAVLGTYTLKFQDATHYWGRRMAGETSVEAELAKAGEGDEGAYQKGVALGRSIFNRSFQDAITPQVQNVRNVLFMVSVVAIPIIGFIYQEWYVAILGFIAVWFLVIILKKMLPHPGSDFFKRRILSSVSSRTARHERSGNALKAEAGNYMLMLLTNTQSDTDVVGARSQAEQIAVWVAEEYTKRRSADHLAEEGLLSQEILAARYANTSPEMRELAASNQPYVSSLSTLCFAILNMEAEGGRNQDTLHKLHRECLSHLRKTGVIEEGGETARLKQVEDIIEESLEASGLQAEQREMAKSTLFEALISNHLYRQYDTDEKLQSFISDIIGAARKSAE